MLAMSWRVSAAVFDYLRLRMPTSRLVDWLRTPTGLPWAVPVAAFAAPLYLFAMSVCVSIVERGGHDYVNALVLTFAWNSIKFVVVAVLTPVRWLTVRAGMGDSGDQLWD